MPGTGSSGHTQYTRSEAKAWAHANLNGFHGAPLTPFTRDGDVGLPALRHKVDALAGMGMDGIGTQGRARAGAGRAGVAAAR